MAGGVVLPTTSNATVLHILEKEDQPYIIPNVEGPINVFSAQRE